MVRRVRILQTIILRLVLFGLVLLELVPSFSPSTLATTFAPEAGKLSYQVKQADAIVTGEVKRVRPRVNTTLVTFKVSEWLKWKSNQELKSQITIVTESGLVRKVVGAPDFKEGERVLLMLKKSPVSPLKKLEKGQYQVLFMELGKHSLSHRKKVIKLAGKAPQKPSSKFSSFILIFTSAGLMVLTLLILGTAGFLVARRRKSAVVAFFFSTFALLTTVPLSMFTLPTPLADLLGMTIGPGALIYSLLAFIRVSKPRSLGQTILTLLALILAGLVTAYNYFFIFGSGGPTFITDFLK